MTVSTVKFSQFAAGSLANTTNSIVGVTAPSGGTNFKIPFPLVWTTPTRPSSPSVGTQGYNISFGQIEFWNGAAWTQLAAGGSGSVALGAQNELAWYAANGTAVSGLMTSNSSVLTTNSSGVPAWSTTLPSGLTITTPNIVGVNNSSDAAAGSVGEFISSQVLYAARISLTAVTPANVTMIDLDGDFDVWGNVYFPNTGQSVNCACWISQSSATSPDLSMQNEGFATGGPTVGISAPPIRVNTSGSTTIYLSCIADFGSGSVSACGGIYARRRR